ncbi:MAG: LytTR family DNA-binding domain-containing protein [Rhizobiaceae bacterium]|nr:LytTR family DNA-binding domain-containing protein [Rhizobiaceae bacterium]
MTDRTLQFTLREWWRQISAPKAIVGMIGAGLILGLSGPFGTYGSMQPGPRLIYWLAIAFGSFSIGLLNARMIGEFAPLRKWGVLPAYGVAGIIGGLPVYLMVELVNLAAGRGLPDNWSAALEIFAYCTAINLCICVLLAWFHSADAKEADAGTHSGAGAKAAAPALMKRLPIELRGQLSHLSMQDHYVEVVTDRGSKLVLMRLADAISEVATVPGIRIHRSHWVALAAVARTRRDGDRLFVEMKDGTVLPISRSSVPAARAAGLMPSA